MSILFLTEIHSHTEIHMQKGFAWTVESIMINSNITILFIRS